jgi:DNA-binding NarL/FixJ family response regulator/Tfp pilus assembly protein PilF
MNEYSKLSVLIVDPNVGMRGNLQNMLAQSEITKIDYAVSAGTAIKLIAKKSYDIILCEYDLGNGQDGQDGQQLLEDLRHHKLIGMWTIFIMITSESVYGKVVSAAELGPTDYILKPFTVDVLVQRIGRALEKRIAFLPVYQLIVKGEQREAARACAAAESDTPRYAADFARLRAELQMSLGDTRDAEETYRRVADERQLGWARLGVAKTQFAQGRYADAEQTLGELIAANDKLMDAYDWLARTYEAQDRPADAQRALESAVAISPHVVRRLRRLGEVALEAGDAQAAERAYKQVVAKARYSEFRDPEDHLSLIRALVRKGEAANAAGVLRDLDKSLRGHDRLELCKTISSAVLEAAAGHAAVAADALGEAMIAYRAGAAMPSRLKLMLAQTCMEQRLDDAAAELMHGLVGEEGGMSMAEAQRAFEHAGRSDLAANFRNRLRKEVEELVRQAAQLGEQRDLQGACKAMLEAARLAPGDARVLEGAVVAALARSDALGWDAESGEQVRQMLDTLARMDPEALQVTALQQRYQAQRRKYGIAA